MGTSSMSSLDVYAETYRGPAQSTMRRFWLGAPQLYRARIHGRGMLVLISPVLIAILHQTIPHSSTFWHSFFEWLYYIPVFFAARSFGLAGAIPTAAVAVVVYIPHIEAAGKLAPDRLGELVVFFLLSAVIGQFAGAWRESSARARELARRNTEMNRDLEVRLEQVRRADRLSALGKLSCRLVHELRNSLAGLRGAVDLLEQGSLPEDLRCEFLQVAKHECGRMDVLFSDVLDVARPHRQQQELLSAIEFLDPVARLAIAASGANAVSVHKDIPPDLPALWGNKVQLEQVFLNLTLNAVQSMPQGGEVVISAECRQSHVLFRVTDQGRGIAAELLDRIFEPFFTTKEKGTGIGLCVAREIVQQHGGRIWAEPNEANGMTFCVLLPSQQVSQS